MQLTNSVDNNENSLSSSLAEDFFADLNYNSILLHTTEVVVAFVMAL